MKQILYFFVIYSLCNSLSGCGLKRKTRSFEKQLILQHQLLQQERKQVLQKWQTDTSALFSLEKQGALNSWHLKGKVMFLADGSVLAEEASIQTWSSKQALIEGSNRLSNITLAVETEQEVKEALFSNTKIAKAQTSRKTAPTWWVVLFLLMTLLILVFWKRWYRKL